MALCTPFSDPSLRPTFDQIVAELERMAAFALGLKQQSCQDVGLEEWPASDVLTAPPSPKQARRSLAGGADDSGAFAKTPP